MVRNFLFACLALGLVHGPLRDASAQSGSIEDEAAPSEDAPSEEAPPDAHAGDEAEPTREDDEGSDDEPGDVVDATSGEPDAPRDPDPSEVSAAPSEVTPPVDAEEEVEEVRVSGTPGRGFTVEVGDAFSATLRARAQIRASVRIEDEAEATFELRTLRIWWTGHVLDPHVRYGIQLALGPNDFEAGNPSPIFDAFVELTHLRDLNVKIGQFFVPFDRARTVRESSLMTVDRTDVVRELTLDRDIGVVVGSSDLFGLGGVLSYSLGLFGGEGRNHIGFEDPGFLYTARASVRPFGEFDDDAESDLSRSPNPRLAIGAGIAFNHMSERPRSTTGVTFERAQFDYLHLAVDAVFKIAGVSFLGELVWREANLPAVAWVDDNGQPRTEFSRSGWGYLGQVGVLIYEGFELWGRWEQTIAAADTDPAFIAQVGDSGRGLSFGANYYVNGHSLKVQADWQHTFGDDFGAGSHLVRLQLDASF